MSNETAAERAKRVAREATEKQDRETAEAKARADAAEAARQSQSGDGARQDAVEKAVDEGQTAETDARSTDVASLLSRLDAQDRLIATLTAQAAGGSGPALDASKDVTASGPGAQFDPRLTRVMGPGTTSGPAQQPHPSTGGDVGFIGNKDPMDWEDGEVTVWGRDASGRPIRPRTYPVLKEQDVRVTSTGYYEDAVRNQGDVIPNYSGPFASWLQPIDADGRDIPREALMRKLKQAA